MSGFGGRIQQNIHSPQAENIQALKIWSLIIMKKETKNWLNMVDYDLTTAEQMFETGRYI